MNTLNIFSKDDVFYVMHATITFPCFDGKPRFDLDHAMKVIAVPCGGDKWRTRLNAIEVTDYLGTLQKGNCTLSAASLWAQCWAIRKILDSGKVPAFATRVIDWPGLEHMAYQMVEENFSFDLLKHAVKSAS
jgi:hypothetical protein